MSGVLHIRALTEADLPAVPPLSKSVGWPHRLEDWRFVHGLGFGLAAEQDGALLGTAMGWRHGDDAGALGMIIVAPAAQGRGLGRRLTEAVIDRLGAARLFLHATEAGLPLYERLGFRVTGLVRQHQGLAGPVAPARDARVRPATAGDLAAMQTLDRAASGQVRDAAIAALLAVGAAVVLERHGAVAGFAVLRQFGRGELIGPVVAPDPDGARALIAHCIAARPGAFLRIDVDAGAGFGDWLTGLGLREVDGAIPMLRGAAPPDAAQARSFALINQALG